MVAPQSCGSGGVAERQCWSLVAVARECEIVKGSLPESSLATYRRATTTGEAMEEKKRTD